MAKPKITIQHIADSLGLSRNTVSKALNGNATIPEDTRNKVVKKAIELKYKQFAFVDTDSFITRQSGNIALLTSDMPTSPHFGAQVLSGLEEKISAEGYNLSIHIVREADLDTLSLPNNFESKKVDGIICIEMFNNNYSRLISNLGIPTIYIDSTADLFFSELNADVILMENEYSTYLMTKKLIDNGHTSLGFAGDYNHCKSFNERWAGFNKAIQESNIPLDLSLCIVEDDRKFNLDWMEQRIGQMKRLPSAFICANDFIAISVMKILKNRSIHIPDDVAICGFDNTPESRIVEPLLTTVQIFNDEMGIIAADMLLSRIKHPSKPFQMTHIKTEPIFRASTGKLNLQKEEKPAIRS
ncbi:LacI family DNA-binding transcriptional regulator [Paenibacillus alkaliterrae]|uniref:LacI family DNA-binding transcriptional regulator n=1 Tax=Paenibacillus alkaliterrae TaxID=320909 RepID=UPI001F261119|nr:LacI family DNA-binding transcriptional regulator [Paenibacillus alkaliterrae]MCF2941300.1 LacI family DNA-binding transcriptional regulator [Paenibacillus alkaliterrae]